MNPLCTSRAPGSSPPRVPQAQWRTPLPDSDPLRQQPTLRAHSAPMLHSSSTLMTGCVEAHARVQNDDAMQQLLASSEAGRQSRGASGLQSTLNRVEHVVPGGHAGSSAIKALRLPPLSAARSGRGGAEG